MRSRPTCKGPQLFNATYPIKVQSLGSGTVSINFQANRDRDNATLEYRVYRRASGAGGNGTLRHTRSVTAPFFNRPVMTWTDSGVDVVPGTTYEYRVQVTDGYNSNFANSAWTSITVAGGAATPPYLAAVLASEPDTLLAPERGAAAPPSPPTSPAGALPRCRPRA